VFEEDRARVVGEVVRVLEPGGRFVLSTPNHGGGVERVKRVVARHAWLRAKLPSMCYPDAGSERAGYHPYRYHRPVPDREIVAMLTRAGLRVERVSHFLFILKSTGDALFGPGARVEAALERVPGVRKLAATVCVVAAKPS
jgi:hypothetical protein